MARTLDRGRGWSLRRVYIQLRSYRCLNEILSNKSAQRPDTETPPISAPQSVTPCSDPLDGVGEGPHTGEAGAPSVCLQPRQHRKLTREQSTRCVEIENQQAENEPFQSWTVTTGPWGESTNDPSEPEIQNVSSEVWNSCNTGVILARVGRQLR
jgi:hypothetical protein